VNTIFHDDYKTEDEEEEENEVEVIEPEDPLAVPAAGAVDADKAAADADGGVSAPVSPVPAVPAETPANCGGGDASIASAMVTTGSSTQTTDTEPTVVGQGPIVIPQRLQLRLPLYQETAAKEAVPLPTTEPPKPDNNQQLTSDSPKQVSNQKFFYLILILSCLALS
jgi:hypothetical protein